MKALILRMDKKVLIGALVYICLLACVITLSGCGGNSSDQQTIDSDVIPTVTAAAEISDGQIQLEIDSEQGTLQGSESAQTISEADVIDEVSNTEVMEMDSIDIWELQLLRLEHQRPVLEHQPPLPKNLLQRPH